MTQGSKGSGAALLQYATGSGVLVLLLVGIDTALTIDHSPLRHPLHSDAIAALIIIAIWSAAAWIRAGVGPATTEVHQQAPGALGGYDQGYADGLARKPLPDPSNVVHLGRGS